VKWRGSSGPTMGAIVGLGSGRVATGEGYARVVMAGFGVSVPDNGYLR